MNLNLDSDRMIILAYPRWGGGKFLANCLGLSSQVHLQDAELAKQQNNGVLPPSKKQQLLLDRLGKINQDSKWTDLDLGCGRLFSLINPARAVYDPQCFNPVITELSNDTKYFFRVAHSEFFLKDQLRTWKNAQVIILKNTWDYVAWRHSYICQNLYDDVPWLESQMFKCLEEYNNPVYVWDVNNYLNEDAFQQAIKDCYQYFNLTDFDYSLIQPFYLKYIDTMKLMMPRLPEHRRVNI